MARAVLVNNLAQRPARLRQWTVTVNFQVSNAWQGEASTVYLLHGELEVSGAARVISI